MTVVQTAWSKHTVELLGHTAPILRLSRCRRCVACKLPPICPVSLPALGC